MIVNLIIALVVVGVIVAEYLLCIKLKNPLWGGIIPLLLLAGIMYAFVSGSLPLESKRVFSSIILLVFIIIEWGKGREKYGKMQQEEINKMKAKDIY